MKCLVYDVAKEIYEWKTIDLSHVDQFARKFFFKDGTSCQLEDPLKIKFDVRDKYYICGNCRKLVRKEDWEQHCADMESGIHCECCDERKLIDVGLDKEKLKKLPNGNYEYSVKKECQLNCQYNSYYNSIPVKQAIESHRCKFFKCRTTGHRNLPQTSLSTYPKLYDSLPTINAALSNKGWHMVRHTNTECKFQFKKTNLYVIFNKLGIFESFLYEARSETYVFKYTKEYDFYFNARVNRFYRMNAENIFPASGLTRLDAACKELFNA